MRLIFNILASSTAGMPCCIVWNTVLGNAHCGPDSVLCCRFKLRVTLVFLVSKFFLLYILLSMFLSLFVLSLSLLIFYLLLSSFPFCRSFLDNAHPFLFNIALLLAMLLDSFLSFSISCLVLFVSCLAVSLFVCLSLFLCFLLLWLLSLPLIFRPSFFLTCCWSFYSISFSTSVMLSLLHPFWLPSKRAQTNWSLNPEPDLRFWVLHLAWMCNLVLGCCRRVLICF